MNFSGWYRLNVYIEELGRLAEPQPDEDSEVCHPEHPVLIVERTDTASVPRAECLAPKNKTLLSVWAYTVVQL